MHFVLRNSHETGMQIEIIQAGHAEKAVIENLFPLYLHDLSEFSDVDVDGQGRFLQDGALDPWWENDTLFPFLIRVDEQIAGFALVATPPYVSKGRDYRLNEFFILRRYRQRGIGLAAATAVFDRLHGAWEVGWLPTNLPAAAFWRKTIERYTQGRYQEGRVMESAEEGLPGLYFKSLERRRGDERHAVGRAVTCLPG
jgi:predicted acetyltransferase